MNIAEQFKLFALLGADWILWLLFLLSVISVTVAIERILYFRGKRPDLTRALLQVKTLLQHRDTDGARELLQQHRGVSFAVGLAAFEELPNGTRAMEESAAGARIREKLKLEKNLAFLGTIGSNAPFVGLLGTVIGIIRSFHDLSMDTTGGAATVMTGVSEALVTTAVGLLVAIPAVVMYNIFKRRIQTLLGDADALVHAILSAATTRESNPT